ncbi:hypothetical protein DRP05_15195 [Archaeoglobales archaeon]|nr:MAG: hypothetical protein DRP05_15195 [Archaeoglobales archaeon]
MNIDLDEMFSKSKSEKSRHKLLVDLLIEKLNKKYIGDMVDDLRRLRTNSDYYMNLIIDESDVEFSLKTAEKLLKELEDLT